MIGVSATAADLETAAEFFELFKTPWEPADPARKYSVLLSADGRVDGDADLTVIYGSASHANDAAAGAAVTPLRGPLSIDVRGTALPIYGDAARFDAVTADAAPAFEYWHEGNGGRVWRVGYDLFHEIAYLLREGQPAAWAATPTLDLHIDLLRQILIQAGAPFVEVPPRPLNRDFICCLTHDLDFHGIRRHRADRTLAGFLARASVGSLVDLLRGRRTPGEALRNWASVLALPFVHLRAAKDFWRPFDSYAEAEPGRRSTFFVVPFRDRPGKAPGGAVRRARAVAYQASDVEPEIREALNRGAEVAVHGIDAWRDAAAGRAEMRELTTLTGRAEAGVRMHWLYFDADSPRQLEAAGYEYDSTWGYNDAIGYRAGTSQVFRLNGSRELLELPLAIMDSAMFYPDRMNLPRTEALRRCSRIVSHARIAGGTVVINWHDRSLAPERLWGRAYRALLDEVAAGDRVWFATAGEAVAWYRWRRSIRFRVVPDAGCIALTVPQREAGLPAGVLRVHRGRRVASGRAEDLPVDGTAAIRVLVA